MAVAMETITLASGHPMPVLGLGTFQSYVVGDPL
jgi:diketogulonate reductase-like aldo/keto reductase